MAINYNQRLSNLQSRKYDETLNESMVSKNFSTRELPENIKYLVESMRRIDDRYNAKTIAAAENVRNHLERGYNLHFSRAYRTQGSVKTATNIRIHSDFDLLNIIDKYYYPDPNIEIGTYNESLPSNDINQLRLQSVAILKKVYDDVDESGDKCVRIFNKSLNRSVDVVFGFWFNSQTYTETGNEFYRGIKFTPGGKTDFPFAHLQNINSKGDQTADGSRRAIRLLKNLKADSDFKFRLIKGFHVTSIVHAIQNEFIGYTPGNDLNISTRVLQQLQKMITDAQYRKSVKSPNGTEFPFIDDKTVLELQVIKTDLQDLIIDCGSEINSPAVKRALLTY